MENPRRRFTILDAMIVVAAAAIAIVWTHAILEFTLREYQILGFTDGGVVIGSLQACIPALVLTNFAVLIMRSIQPRPSWRRIARQPGAAACGGVAFGVCLLLILRLATLAFQRLSGLRVKGFAPSGSTTRFVTQSLTDMGLIVVGAWLALGVTRRWRAESSWIDLSGRLLGVCWIALYLAFHVITLLMLH